MLVDLCTLLRTHLLTEGQDLLLALQAHASAFYASTGLLIPEIKRQRSEPWQNRKRRLLESEGVVSAPAKRGRPRLCERAIQIAPEAQEQRGNEDGRTHRTKGRYIKRDTFQAFEGQALLVLGELMVKNELTVKACWWTSTSSRSSTTLAIDLQIRMTTKSLRDLRQQVPILEQTNRPLLQLRTRTTKAKPRSP